MIGADVLIVDLEPEGFAHLSEVLSHRLYRTSSEIQILHSSGQVLNVVDTREGVVDRYRESFDDPQARAEEIFQEASETGVQRVLVVDKNGIDSLCEAQVRLAMSIDTQTDLLWRGNEEFLRSSAVAVAPEPAVSPWPRISDRLKSIGGEWWVVLGAWKEEDLYLSLIAKVEGGLVTFATSADGFGERPPRGQSGRLIEMVEGRGPVAVALLCDILELDRILRLEDPLGELAVLQEADGIFDVRGLGQLIGEGS